MFRKQFLPEFSSVVYHYYCCSCLIEIDKDTKLCPNPDCHNADLDAEVNRFSFIEVSISPHLQRLLESKYNYTSFYKICSYWCTGKEIFEIVSTVGANPIGRGDLYKELMSSSSNSSCNTMITLTFNTDGIPVFKSSNYSFWPLFLVINELPFNIRSA